MALKNIVGALKGAAGGAGRAGAKLSEKLDDLLFIALKIVAIGVACIAVYKYSGLRAGGDELAWYMLFGLGICAVGFEYYGAQTIIDGWYDRALGAVGFGAALCIPALFMSYASAISSSAVQQSQAAGLQQAAFFKATDSRKAIKDLEGELELLKSRVDWSRTLDAPDAYNARIEAADKDAAFEATRGGCKSKCISKQQLAASLRAEKANSVERAITEEEIKITQGKLEEARSHASEAPAVVSEVRADTLEYAAWFGTDATGGQSIQARHVAITITLFVTFTGFLTGWKRNRDRNPRPWGFVTKLRRMVYRIWNGSEEGFAEPQSGPGQSAVYVNLTDEQEKLARMLNDKLERMRASIKVSPAVSAA